MERARQSHRVAMTGEVEIDHVRRFADEVIVQRALFDAPLLQRIDDGIHFRFEENKISHGHRPSAARLPERDP